MLPTTSPEIIHQAYIHCSLFVYIRMYTFSATIKTIGTVILPANPGSCIVVSTPIGCAVTRNDGCQHIAMPIHNDSITISIHLQNQSERLNIIFYATQCPISGEKKTLSYSSAVQPVGEGLPGVPWDIT